MQQASISKAMTTKATAAVGPATLARMLTPDSDLYAVKVTAAPSIRQRARLLEGPTFRLHGWSVQRFVDPNGNVILYHAAKRDVPTFQRWMVQSVVAKSVRVSK